MCVDVQVYESKLQELQKQVETRSLIAETPDEEELEEEEEEEGAYLRSEVHFFPPNIASSRLSHLPLSFYVYFPCSEPKPVEFSNGMFPTWTQIIWHLNNIPLLIQSIHSNHFRFT